MIIDDKIFEHCIHSIEIKGQELQLAAPIAITGKFDYASFVKERDNQDLNPSQQGSPVQIGVDEAGRGPLLGSVNIAAVLLPNAWSDLIANLPLRQTPLSTLTDSKQLSEKKRDALYPLIRQYAIAYTIVEVPAAVIDQVNILQATMLGMRLSVEMLLEHLALSLEALSLETLKAQKGNLITTETTQVLFDGNRYPELDYFKLNSIGIDKSAVDCQAWVKGDARHTSIAAASVLAKVSRDQKMYSLHAKHPQYSIAKHKGYPTRAHIEAINSYGVLAEHRRSFAPVKQALESA